MCGRARALPAGCDSALAYCVGRPVDAGKPTLSASDISETHPEPFGPYHVSHEIGRGAAGVVYAARDKRDGREVALKVLHSARADHDHAQQRFEREAAALSRLTDRGVVRLIDHGRTPDGHRWLAMEHVEGPSLAEVLQRSRALPLGEALRIGLTLARTLARLHAKGVFHRDVKPSNLLITLHGEPRLVDFGVARDAHPVGTDLTHTGQLLGTLAYMAPELVRGVHDEVDWALAEQWSFGAMLHEMILGARPLGTPDPANELPRIVHEVLVRLLHPTPSARYPDMATVAEDLERALQGRSPRHAGLWWRASNGARANPIAVALGTIVLAGLGAAAVTELRDAVEAASADRAWQATQARVDAHARAGETAEALALLDDFVDDPHMVGRTVVGEAWLYRAKLARSGGDPEEALSQAARVVANYPELGSSALASLAETLWEVRDLQVLARLLPEVPDAPAAWRLDAALATGDLGAAAALVEDPRERALFARWSRRAPAEGFGPSPGNPVADVDGDGRAEHVREGPPGSWTLDRSDGARVPLPEVPPPHWLQPTSGDAGWLLRMGPRPEAWKLGPDGVTARIALDGLPLRGGTAAGDDLFVSTQGAVRDVFHVSLTDPVPRSVDPDLTARASHISEALACDLDGDARPELVMTVGPPEGYELRVYGTGEPSGLRARRRVGFALGLTALDGKHLVASVTHQHPSAALFGEASPEGPPAGLYMWSLAGERLQPAGWTAGPAPRGGQERSLAHPIVGDVDGDGERDLVWTVLEGERQMVGFAMALARGDGRFTVRLVEGLLPEELRDVDGDGAPELFVRTSDAVGERFALGTGDPWIPPPAAPRPDGWAELLSWAGRPSAAARAEEVLAYGSDEPSSHWARAAEHWESDDDWSRAGDAWRHGEGLQARSRELAALVAAGRLEDATERAVEGPADGDPLREWLLTERRAIARPGASLAPYAKDLGVRADPLDGSLQVDVVPGSRVALEVPIASVGPTPGITWTGAIRRAEFSSGLVFTLRSGDRDIVGIDLIARDLGGGPFLAAACGPTPVLDLPMTDLPDPIPVRATLRFDGDHVRCVLDVAGHVASVRLQTGHGRLDRPLAAQVRAVAAGGDPGALFTLRLDEVRIVDGSFGDPSGTPPPDGPLPATPGPARVLALRLHPQESLARLSADLGPDVALNALLDAWAGPLASEDDDPELARLLTRLEGFPATPGPARATLALAQARHALRSRDSGAAVPRIDELVGDPRADAATRDEAYLLRVDLVLAAGRTEDALVAARGAVDASPTPLLVADRLLRRPLIQAQRDDPAWSWLFALAPD